MTQTSFAQGQLRAFVERIERLEEEKAALAADIREVYAEAKGNGFDVKILRKVIRLHGQDRAERDEEQALLDLYLNALEGSAPGLAGDMEEVGANDSAAASPTPTS
jgi:uncharacterized protein (UPF0335 family)